MTAKNTKQKPWTAAEDDLLRQLYDTISASQIAEQLGRSKAAIKNRINKLGLTKGHNPGLFKKGITPWNKGTHYVAGGRSAETRFKKGDRKGRANNLYQPVGTERLSKDGYLERKINDDLPLQRRWRSVHLIVWESVNGPLPKSHAVVFKDGDKKNITLNNLELVSRAELMRRNTYHRYGEEIAQLIQLRGALNRQINKRKPHE